KWMAISDSGVPSTMTRNLRRFSGAPARPDDSDVLMGRMLPPGGARGKRLKCRLFQEDVGDFAKLRAGPQQVEALHREMVGLELGIRRAVHDHPGIEQRRLAEALHHLVPGLLQIAFLDDRREFLAEALQHHVVA